MNERTRFVGLDVHKATIAVAVAGSFSDPEDHGQIAKASRDYQIHEPWNLILCNCAGRVLCRR